MRILTPAEVQQDAKAFAHTIIGKLKDEQIKSVIKEATVAGYCNGFASGIQSQYAAQLEENKGLQAKISRIKEILDELTDYRFECVAGPLEYTESWTELKELIG